MTPKTIQNYGGPFVSESIASNPETQVSDTKFNRLAEDAAQATRTVTRCWVEFKTNTTTNPPASDVTHAAVWGSSDANKPTVTRDAAGKYTITWAASYNDALGVTETVGIRFASRPSVRDGSGLLYSAVVKDISSNAVKLWVYDNASPPVVSDLAGAAYVCVEIA